MTLLLRQNQDVLLVRQGKSALPRIYGTAIELFAERGFAGTGIRDIAEGAGVSTAVLYHHLRSKEQLLADIMRRSLHLLNLLAERRLIGSTSPVESLGRLVQVHTVLHALNRQTSMVVDGEMRQLNEPELGEMIALRDAYEELWTSVLREGVASGDFAIRQLHLTRIALIQMIGSVVQWYSPTGDLTLDDITDHLVNMSLRLVGLADDAASGELLRSLPPVSSYLSTLDALIEEFWTFSN